MNYNLIISGEIGSWWNGCSADYVRYVLNTNKDKEVHVGFCSPGGYVADGLEMYQAFKDHGNVHAHAFGLNASISTIAMLGCKTIDIVKGSLFLIHNVSTVIFEYDQANKEQIDQMVQKLNLKRNELKTFDDVLAELYSEKTGKPTSDCLAQMKKGNWMTAQQALEFGLVDSIREDEKAEKAAKNFKAEFVNLYNDTYKNAGIPPLPAAPVVNDKISNIVDSEGNPSEKFLEKTMKGLKGLFTKKDKNEMIKNYTNVMDLVKVDGFETTDNENVSVSLTNMKTIDDKLKEYKDTLDKMQKEKDSLSEKLKKYETDLKEKDEQVKTLQESPADETKEEASTADTNAVTATDLFNLVKDM